MEQPQHMNSVNYKELLVRKFVKSVAAFTCTNKPWTSTQTPWDTTFTRGTVSVDAPWARIPRALLGSKVPPTHDGHGTASRLLRVHDWTRVGRKWLLTIRVFYYCWCHCNISSKEINMKGNTYENYCVTRCVG